MSGWENLEDPGGPHPPWCDYATCSSCGEGLMKPPECQAGGLRPGQTYRPEVIRCDACECVGDQFDADRATLADRWWFEVNRPGIDLDDLWAQIKRRRSIPHVDPRQIDMFGGGS